MTYPEQEKRGLYRSRDGVLFGVCKGIAEYLNFSVFWMRVIAVFAMIFFFPWTIGAYILAALLIKPEPIVPFQSEADEEFYNSLTSSRSMALHRLKRTYDNLDRRIQRIEGIVTARDFNWDRKLKE
ncbi:MAG TPA: envelope stress response membrane protein PspC [Candidatus Hydrogenedentes bacterium]|nr:envelope stress response membrane protein PspC [Candidatus Hydrogenedentota bacterium]